MNKTKREGAAHGKTGWDPGRIGRQLLVVLILVSSLFGMVGFTAVPTTDDGSTTAENPVVTTVPTAEPSAEPTPAPDVTTTPEPTVVPTAEPTAEPTPTVEPIATPEPTAEQTPTPDVEPTPDAESEIPVTLHIIPAPDAEEERVSFTVSAGSSLDLLVNDSVHYSLTGGADTYSAEGETEPEQTETEQTETWEWYTLDAEGGKVPYDLSAPITAPLDVYAARGVATTAATTKTVMFYVAVNGEWVQLTDKTTTVDKTANFTVNGSTTTRYYITANELETAYSKFGFYVDSYRGENFFPHSDDQKKMWADVSARQSDDQSTYWIPLGSSSATYNDRTTYYVYYVPNENTKYESDGSIAIDTALAGNSFYTIEFNGNGKVDSKGLPQTQYVFNNGNFTYIGLPALTDAGAEWKVVDKIGNEVTDCTITKDADGKVTVFIPSITAAVEIVALGDDYRIVYNAELTKVDINGFSASNQTISKNGTINNGQSEYSVLTPKSTEYTVLAVDNDRAEVLVANPKTCPIFYTFKYWKINNTEYTVFPGTKLSTDELAKYAAGSDTITLTAVWSPFEKTINGDNAINTVNFYVSYDCEILSNNGLEKVPTDQSHYTPSIFATRVNGTLSDTSANVNSAFDIIKDSDGTSETTEQAMARDEKIRNLMWTPVSGLTLAEFPMDDAVLNQLREGVKAGKYNIKLGSTNIEAQYLTPDHFTIRWFAFKYEHSDGYHIDGVLVAKAARLVVTKTFTGSADVIAEVKKNFYIEVEHSAQQRDTTEVEDYKLVLKAAGETTLAKDETGYTSYDPKTDTYTWVLEGYQNMEYTVKESGYGIPSGFAEYTHTARYMVRNPNQSTAAPTGWASCPADGVTVTVASYAKDIPDSAVQTVALENMYVKTGTVTVAKRDSVTGHGISDVKFTLTMEDAQEGETTFQLYHKPNSSQYSSDEEAGYTETVDGNVIVTGSSGYIYLKLKGGHTYTLTEQIPLGYNGAASVTFYVGDDGTITNIRETCYKDDQGNEIKLPSGNWAKADGAVLSIDNLSHVLTEVKVKCNWGGSAADQKEVTVQLWRDGAPMVGEKYTVTLIADGEWSHVWSKLPLFADGKLAEYTVRPTFIGDTAYDANISGVKDGYANYDVTFNGNLYKKGADGDYTHLEGCWLDEDGKTNVFADHMLIEFNIEPVFGTLKLSKLSDSEGGSPLEGAQFTLYSNEECTNSLGTAVSIDDGEVKFDLKLAAGTYYLKETGQFPGYARNDTVYRVLIHAGIATVTVNNGDGIPVHTVVNETSQTLTINKVNQYDSPVPGATFTLTREGDYEAGESNDLPQTYTSDEYGRITLTGLERGTYVLKETAAPNGYKQLDTKFKFIVADGKIFVPENVHVPDGWVLTETQEGGYTLTVTNQVLYVFPTTGGVGIYAPIALGAVLMCTSAVLIIKRKRETA